MSSTDGSLTSTFWKRRSSAASFSMYLRYSSSVVAPTQCSSPRASAGLSMLPASIEPSALPAPTTVCSSSMNRITRPSCFARSLSTPLSRSSNSPRNLAPAINAPMSSERMRLSRRLSGTSPLTMRCARPSTIAVLPTPGSPISTGLFLVRRCSTWMVRRISSSRPITGSSLPCVGALGQVDRVLLERLPALLGIRVVDLLAAANLLDGLLERALDDADIAQQLAERALVLERGQHEELARDVLVAALLRELVGQVQQLAELVRDLDVAARRPRLSADGRASGRAASAAG